VLLAGITTKVVGVYVIIRLMSDVFVGLAAPSQAFMLLGAFSIVVGAFAAIGQREMKRMLAFSSISQMGYIILAAGLATPLALIGAVVHFVNHALFKSLLFVNATAVEEQTGTTEFEKLGGLTEKLKVTGWTSVIGLLSTAGIPPLSGFWSKLLIIVALAMAGQWLYAALAVLMSLVTLGYFLILQRKVFFGKLREGFEELHEARGSLVGASLALAGLTTALGLLFPLVLIILSNFGLV
jgi:multicomponent Na+:H+ antiporter subunit D